MSIDTIYPDSILGLNEFSLVKLESNSKFSNKFKSYTSKGKDYVFDIKDKTIDFLKKPETKIASLISYWAVESLVTCLGMYAFISLGMYAPAVISFAILVYLTYATFGVVNEVRI